MEEGYDYHSNRTQRAFNLLKKFTIIPDTKYFHIIKKQSRHSLLLINIIYYLFKNSFLHFVHVGWQNKCRQFTNQGDCRKIGWGNWGEKRGTPKAGVPHLHHTARRWAECWRALLCHQGSLEKDLHRRYSKTEFYNKGVFHVWEAVFAKNIKKNWQSLKFQPDTYEVELAQRRQLEGDPACLWQKAGHCFLMNIGFHL